MPNYSPLISVTGEGKAGNSGKPKPYFSRVKNILAKMDSKREGERSRKHKQKGPFK